MKTKHLRLMQRTYIILFFGFMYLPIAYMILFSFNESKGYALFTGFTLKWYESLLHNSSILRALAVSIEVALVSAVVATVLGTAASLGIAGMKRTSRLLITNVTYIPVVNPEIITGISLMLLFVAYQRFAAGVPWLPDTIMGMPTLLIAHVAFNVPYVIFNVSPPAGRPPVRGGPGPGLRPPAGLLQGHPARDQPGHPLLLFDLPDLLHRRFHDLLLQLRHRRDAAHRHLLHDPPQGQSGDLCAVHHHVRGHPGGDLDLERGRGPPLPAGPDRPAAGPDVREGKP